MGVSKIAFYRLHFHNQCNFIPMSPINNPLNRLATTLVMARYLIRKQEAPLSSMHWSESTRPNG